jgi:predicted HicB family RNase H-like nuclease
MTNTMKYKGYIACVEFDDDADLFHGEVVNIPDVITFQGTSVAELRQAFQDSVEDYLEFCEERGEAPDKPFSGQFVLRLKPALHRDLTLLAARAGKSLNAWIAENLEAITAEKLPAVAASGGVQPKQERPKRKRPTNARKAAKREAKAS